MSPDRLYIAPIRHLSMTSKIMASSASLLQPSVYAKAHAASAPRAARRFSFSDLLDVFGKAMMMAQALPDSGRPTARQIEEVRKIADTI